MAKKLMIVDGHAVARTLARQAAATPQDTVLECASPDEALKAMSIFQPDCVVMGISHRAPAFAAIRSIREDYPEVRVVAVSDSHEHELRQKAAEAGASGYVAVENISELFLLAAPERLVARPAGRHAGRRAKVKAPGVSRIKGNRKG
jgi:DNA-binding NarL/FixJ family response regulator